MFITTISKPSPFLTNITYLKKSMPTYQSINESYLTMTLHILLIKLLIFSTEEETKPGKKIIQETKKKMHRKERKRNERTSRKFSLQKVSEDYSGKTNEPKTLKTEQEIKLK